MPKLLLPTALLAATLAGNAFALPLALFNNTSFIAATEAGNVTTILTNAGHTVSTFTSITNWTASIGAGNFLVIPDINNNLFAALSNASRTELQTFVSGGGTMLVTGGAGGSGIETNALLDGLFGFSLVGAGSAVASTLQGTAAGTAFQGGPATLPIVNQVFAHTLASLPSGAVSYYNSAGGDSTVWSLAIGSGQLVYVAADFFAVNASWADVLGRAVTFGTPASAATPEPGACALVAMGLGALWLRRIRG